jgi:hypothetical protein
VVDRRLLLVATPKRHDTHDPSDIKECARRAAGAISISC